MEPLWSIVIGILVTVGIYLLLDKHILRILFGLIFLTIGVNLTIFTAGRLTSGVPPLIARSSLSPPLNIANPLPQALILTAIVISFGLLVFTIIICFRVCKNSETADVEKMQLSEKEYM